MRFPEKKYLPRTYHNTRWNKAKSRQNESNDRLSHFKNNSRNQRIFWPAWVLLIVYRKIREISLPQERHQNRANSRISCKNHLTSILELMSDRLIAYASRILEVIEYTYSTIEKEMAGQQLYEPLSILDHIYPLKISN